MHVIYSDVAFQLMHALHYRASDTFIAVCQHVISRLPVLYSGYTALYMRMYVKRFVYTKMPPGRQANPGSKS